MSNFLAKTWWLDVAEVFDAWRVIPRLLVFGYWLWIVWLVDNLLRWYQSLPADERTLEASGFATFVITAVTGMGSWVSKIYMDGGRSWADEHRE